MATELSLSVSQVSPSQMATALEQLFRTEQGRALVKMATNDTKHLKIPVRGRISVPSSGKAKDDFVKKNRIRLLYVDEPKSNRKVTIAYQYEKGTGVESFKRFVKYGACVFRKSITRSDVDTKSTNKKPEVWDKNGHSQTAIRRLMNAPVRCELTFTSIDNFNKDLRKQLFKRGVEDKEHAVPKTFNLVSEETTQVDLTALPASSSKNKFKTRTMELKQ